jgi:hypothetical protein
MENFFAIGLRATLGPCPGAGLVWQPPDNPCAKRALSTLWKIFFHGMEKTARFFHSMEDFLTTFPRYGKYFWPFSTLWKTFFHSVEQPSAEPKSGPCRTRGAPCEP